MKKYNFTKTMTKTVNEVWVRDKKIFIMFLFYILTASITPILGIYMPRYIIQELELVNTDFQRISFIIGIFTIGIGLFIFIEKFVFDIILVRIMEIRIDLLTKIFDKTNRLDYHYTEDPNFLNENNDAYQVIGGQDYEEVIRRLFILVSKVILATFYIYIIIQLHYLIIVGIFASLAIGLLNSFIMKKYRHKQKKAIASANRRINYYETTMQDFSYGKDIRLYEFQDSIEEDYNYEIKSYISILRKIKNKEYFLSFIDIIFVLISDAIFYYFLITKVFDGADIATFSFYLLIGLALSTLLKGFVGDITFLTTKGQHLNDYFNFMETEYNEPTKGINELNDHTLEIEFKNVSFKYPKTDNFIIKNLNLKINKGEKLAIVGVNGAGKTTIVKLLLRLFDPTEGEILVNGINAKDYDKELYFSLFAPVFQEINILAFSVRENITLGLSNDEDKIWQSLEMAGLKEKIESLEYGLDTNLMKNIDDKGIILSGGENQKLAIARALYKGGKMVVLDEPTAALDALAEAEIYENFNSLIDNKTAIFISHRLASTKFCDKIALFDSATLLEYGTHDELMNLKGEYYNMFVVQGKYYQKEREDEII